MGIYDIQVCNPNVFHFQFKNLLTLLSKYKFQHCGHRKFSLSVTIYCAVYSTYPGTRSIPSVSVAGRKGGTRLG